MTIRVDIIQRNFVFFVLAKLVLLVFVFSFFSCKPTQNLLIKSEILSDEPSLDEDEMSSFLRQKPNRKTFGLRFHLGIYKLVDQDKEVKREEVRAKKLAIINDNNKKEHYKKIKVFETKEQHYRKMAEEIMDTKTNKAMRYLRIADKYQTKRKVRFDEKEKLFSFSQWFLEIGEPPVVYDPVLTKKTRNQLQFYLKNKGYYQSQIKDSLVFLGKVHEINDKLKNSKHCDTIYKVSVFYKITAGKPYLIDSVDLITLDPAVKRIVEKDKPNSILRKGTRLDVDLLQQERARINTLLHNNGFYKFSYEYVYFDVDTSLGNYKAKVFTGIKLAIDEFDSEKNIPHKRYKINTVNIYPEYDPKEALDKQEDYYARFDTLLYLYRKKFQFRFFLQNKPILKNDAVARTIYIYRDSIYSTINVDDTYKHLAMMRLFRLSNIEMVEVDNRTGSQFDQYLNAKVDTAFALAGINVDSINEIQFLDCNIKLTPSTIQASTIELEGTNTSGNIGAAGNLIYQHKNIFKRAETFDFKFKTAFERQINNVSVQTTRVFNTQEYGVELSLDVPRLLFISAFTGESFKKRYHPKTNFSLSINYQERPDYTRILSNIGFGYYWQTSPYITHFLTPLSFNSVNLKNPSVEFMKYISGLRIRESYEDHLISAFNYSIIFNNQNTRNRKNFLFVKYSIETAGNGITGMMMLAKKEKYEGSYLFPFFNIVYAQYAKTDIDIRIYQRIYEQNSIVFRLFTGVGITYGDITLMPFGKQYFSGGANSIRAWQVRALGPGSYSLSTDSIIPNQSADIKIESNLEFRKKLFWIIEGAWFIDVGNIWAINNYDNRPGAKFKFNSFFREIAVGAGIGARLDFSFFIFRFDFGKKIYDPQRAEGDRIVMRENLFRTKGWAMNIGIGYPF